MDHPEQTTRNQASATGQCGTLRALFGVQGRGMSSVGVGTAPWTPRRVQAPLVAACAAAIGLLAFSAPATLAATPEQPQTGKATAITATSAKLEGVLNPNAHGELGEYQFAYRVSPTECEGESVTLSEMAQGNQSEAVSATASPLQPNATYTFCLLARNLVGEQGPPGAPVTFTTPAAPPSLLSESASVKPTEARIEGLVNPNNQTTECHVQYGQASISEHEVSCEQATLEGYGEQGIGLSLSGLTQHTTYHYKLIIKNVVGTVEGGEQEFTTPTPEPPETKPATEVTGSTAKLNGILNPMHSGESGSYEFVYRKSAAECQGEGEEVTQNAVAGGLSPEPVAVEVTGLLPGASYTFCLRAINGSGETALGAAVSFKTLVVAPTIGSEYASNVASTSATLTGQVNPGGAETTYRFEYGTTTSYGKSLTNYPVEGAEPETVDVKPQDLTPGTVYHYRLVAGNEVDKAVTGQDQVFTTLPAAAPFKLPDGRVWELVSPPNKNGAEVYTGLAGFGADLQAAENGQAVTYVVNTPLVGGASSPIENQILSRRGTDGWSSQDIATPHNASAEYGGQPRFGESDEYLVFSPADLSLAYVNPEGYTQLDPNAPVTKFAPYESETYVRDNNTGSFKVTTLSQYEWYAQQEAIAQGPPSCDPSTSPANGEGVHAVSRDGCYVYFNTEGGAGQFDISHYESGEWRTTHASSLEGAVEWGGAENASDNQSLTPDGQWGGRGRELSPSGRYLAFMSSMSLTGYDNRDAVSGEPDEEVFLYDAVTNHLVCASCNPTGARPDGVRDIGSTWSGQLLVDRNYEWAPYGSGGLWLAGSLPDWTVWKQSTVMYLPRYLSNTGRLFFNSSDSLVSQATNGQENVYEYEPEDVGSCAGVGGCVSLISAGTSSQESALIGASASGDDVFFLTRSRLTPQDYDNNFDVYDAHVCSESVPCPQSEPVPPPACETGDSCKASPTPQPTVFGDPSSETFDGAGNVVGSAPAVAATKPLTRAQKLAKALKACRHKSKAKRRTCESHARRRYDAKAPKGATVKSSSGTARRRRVGR